MERIRTWLKQPQKTAEEIEKINKHNINASKPKDIIITEIIESTDYDKETGNKITTYEPKTRNITKQINETAKLLKTEQAKELNKKLEELLFGLNKENNQ